MRKVFDDEKVEAIIESIKGPAGKDVWDKLGNISEDLLASFLKNEYPQTVALVLSKVAPFHAAKVLALFSPEFAFEVIKRMLTMDSVKPDVLDRIEKTLRSEFIGTIAKTQKQDNSETVAEVFNNFDRNSEVKLMKMLEKYNLKTAEKVKDLMFTFEDLLRIDSFGIQQILKEINTGILPVALKGASDSIKELFINNMSQRAGRILREELENLGPVRVKEVDKAQVGNYYCS